MNSDLEVKQTLPPQLAFQSWCFITAIETLAKTDGVQLAINKQTKPKTPWGLWDFPKAMLKRGGGWGCPAPTGQVYLEVLSRGTVLNGSSAH